MNQKEFFFVALRGPSRPFVEKKRFSPRPFVDRPNFDLANLSSDKRHRALDITESPHATLWVAIAVLTYLPHLGIEQR